MNNQKVPKIRFKGFSGDWEQRKLGDISTSYSGGTPTAGKDEYYGGTIPFIRSGEISSDHTALFLTERGFNSSSAVMVKQGDILYALYGATSGEVSISKLNGAINQAILAVLPNDGYDTDFIMQWLRKSKDSIVSTYLQGGQGNLSATIVNQLHIDLPSYNEQRRIGAFFKVLDNNITLHQSKLDKLKIIKKSMLENCFPKNGENVPKFRFSGFTGDWEQRKFSDIYQKNDERNNGQFGWNKTISTSTMTFNEIGNGAADSSIDNYKVLRIGDIAFEGHTNKEFRYGRFVLNDIGDGIMSPRFATLRPIIKQDFSFWKHYIHNERIMRKKLVRSTKAGTMMNELVIDDLMEQLILVPSLQEQKKIGAFFGGLNHLITLHQSKLDKLKVIKKTLLESMFV